MHIKSLSVQNFGPLSEADLDFQPSGINSVRGSNATGKTQLVGALTGALLGPAASPLQRHPEGSDAEVRLILSDAGHEEEFRLSAGQGSHIGWHITSRPDSEEAPLRKRLLRATHGIDSPHLIYNLEFHLGSQEEKDLLESAIEDPGVRSVVEEKIQEIPIDGTLVNLPVGVRRALMHVRELILRKNSPISVPLVLDSPYQVFDNQVMRVLLNELVTVAQDDQVIYFHNPERPPFTALGQEAGIDSPDSVHMIESLDRLPRTSSPGLSSNSESHRLSLGTWEESQRLDRESIQKELQELKRLQKESHDETLERLDTQDKKLDRIEDQVLQLRAEVADVVSKFDEEMERAVLQQDERRIEELSSEIAARVTRSARRGIKEGLEDYLEELSHSLGPAWANLSRVSRKDIAVSKQLHDFLEDEGAHLCTLAVCRAIENEIQQKIFWNLRDKLGSEETKELAEASDPINEPPWAGNLSLLAKFLDGRKDGLTLGSSAWLIKTAQRYKDRPLFQALLDSIHERYGSQSERILELIENIEWGEVEIDEERKAKLTEIRNRCAHPPTLDDRDPQVTDLDTYEAVWSHALEEPIELLLRLATPEGSEG